MLKISSIGFYAQLVDQGRRLSMHKGYTRSGALDWCSYQLANAIVGNCHDSLASKVSFSSVEITLGDFMATFDEAAIIAITGASATCFINDVEHEMNHSLYVPKGATLKIRDIGKALKGHHASTLANQKSLQGGMRVYLAIRGGIEAPLMFDSSANVMREKSGGLHGDGRGLQVGDSLVLNDRVDKQLKNKANVHEDAILSNINKQIGHDIEGLLLQKATRRLQEPKCCDVSNTPANIAFIPGYQWNAFAPSQHAKLLSTTYNVTSQADRMGMRLSEVPCDGRVSNEAHKEANQLSGSISKGLVCASQQLYSQGLCNGAMQVAGDGQIIIMLNDRQTIGGYPVLGAVSAISRATLAQLRPGDTFLFSICDELTAAAQISIWANRIKNLANRVDQLLSS